MSLIWLPFIALLSPAPQSENLSERHQRWVDEEVVYIITHDERNRFLELNNDLERDQFIDSFWYARDPVKETLANEYKEEHEQRMKEAQRRFRETPRDAWRTDRGRIHIILGPPNEVQTFPSSQILYPIELWHYYALDIPKLPSALSLMFFKRKGMGEYRLYSPVFDGAWSLIAAHQLLNQVGNNPFAPLPSSLAMQIGTDIFSAMQSVGPGYSKYTSEMVLADLDRPGVIHERMLERLAGRVTADVTFASQITAAFNYHAFQGELGFTEIHLAVEVLPGDLTFTQYDDLYLGRVDIVANVIDSAGNIVEEFQDVAEFSFPPEAFETAQYFPFLYQRKVLLLPGRYEIELLLRSAANRRLGIVRQAVQVAPFVVDQPTASSMLLAYKVDQNDDGDSEGLPYRFGATRFYPMVQSTFGVGQPIYAFINLRHPAGNRESTQIAAHYLLAGEKGVVRENTRHYRSRPLLGDDDTPILLPLATEELEPGTYALTVELNDQEGNLIDELRTDLDLISEAVGLGRLVAEGAPPPKHSENHFELGMKYYYAGLLEMAEKRLRAALDFDPRLVTAKLYLGRSKAMLGRCEEALILLEQVIEEVPTDSEAHASIGFCSYQIERFPDAVAAYRKALQYGTEQSDLLNALGQAEMRVGDHKAAIEAFTRSLELSPEQAEVRAILGEIKSESAKNPQ